MAETWELERDLYAHLDVANDLTRPSGERNAAYRCAFDVVKELHPEPEGPSPSAPGAEVRAAYLAEATKAEAAGDAARAKLLRDAMAEADVADAADAEFQAKILAAFAGQGG